MVTNARGDAQIYPYYAQRFHKTFPAQVCVVFDCDLLIKQLVVITIAMLCLSFRNKCMQMHISCNYRSATETGNVTLYDFMHFNNRVSFF